jgi:hypothetical protein
MGPPARILGYVEASVGEIGMPQTVPRGVFWVDDFEQLEVNPTKRLLLARKYLPLPAAFREAATALRAMILSAARNGADGDDLLFQLYVTAAQANFLLSTPSVIGAGSRYDVAASIPKTIWQQLPMPYAEIGYRHLRLLTYTDCDWLTVAWGEPDRHSTARAHHQAVWDACVAEYMRAC